MTSTSSLRNDSLQFLDLSLCSKKCSQAILGEFTGSFVFVVSQQFDDTFLVWGGSKSISKSAFKYAKSAKQQKVLGQRCPGTDTPSRMNGRCYKSIEDREGWYPQTSLIKDRTALVLVDRAPRRREGRGAISRRRVTCPLFKPTAMPKRIISPEFQETTKIKGRNFSLDHPATLSSIHPS